MLTQIKEQTALHSAFELYEETQREINKLKLEISLLEAKRASAEQLIVQCTKCNEGELACGPYRAKVVNVKEHWRKATSYVKVYLNGK